LCSLVVSSENNQIHVKSAELGDWALSPVSETEFVFLDGGTTITFVKGADGKVEQMKFWGMELCKK
jgi:hypothetical protein